MEARVYAANGHHAHVPEEGIVLNIVHVEEMIPPEGVEPVCWYLLTDQPVETRDEILFVVDCYCDRWIIEELHKGEKTGCQFEHRRMRSFQNCMRMLAFTVPVAVQLLRLRWYDRERSDADANSVLSEGQIEFLHVLQEQNRKEISEQPTVHEVLTIIARLGGHCQHKASPGWLVLYRGFSKLVLMAEGYQMGRDREREQQRTAAVRAANEHLVDSG